MLTLHETLDNILYSLGGKTGVEFKFKEWTHCTCGHIYRGATGLIPLTGFQIWQSGDALYLAAMRAIVRANGLTNRNPDYLSLGDLTDLISNATKQSRHTDRARRKKAIQIVKRTIRMVENDEEMARLAVLAQAESVVNQAAEEISVATTEREKELVGV